MSGLATITESEQRKRNDLEAVIRKGVTTFVEVGAAISMIRDQRLYRSTHETFEAYCQDVWGWSSSRARQLIGAAEVVHQLESVTAVTPANEAQAREISKVPSHQRPAIMRDAKAKATREGRSVRTIDIQEARKRREEKSRPAPEPPPEVGTGEPPAEEAEAVEPRINAAAEWEKATLEVERLEDLVETLKSGKAETELVTLSRKYAQLEGRVRQLTTEAGEAKRQAKSASDLLRKVATKLNVERWNEIMPALEDLLR